jgi:hemerythrin-like domain-containing protein
MLVKIGQTPDHGFDTPLELLSDCHRRIERFLAVLVTIANRRGGGALPDEDRQALAAALRYFATAAPRHTADEEHSLFPRLRASDDARTQAALEVVERLEVDHRAADRHHAAIDALCRHWLETGSLAAPEVASLLDHLTALEHIYRDHIRIEDEDLFPAAGRVLSNEDLEAVGREMAERRGVPFRPRPDLVR